MQAKDIKLTIEEFHNLPEGTHAELINGVLYDMAPSPLRIHQEISMTLSAEIFQYIKSNKGTCKVYTAPFDVKLSDDTVVIPDISVICDKNKLTDKGCTGAPDWIIEIVSSNAVHDYITKLNLYHVYGVTEYWIIDPARELVTVYNFSGNTVEMTQYKFSDIIPVNIYNKNENQLKINIKELLK